MTAERASFAATSFEQVSIIDLIRFGGSRFCEAQRPSPAASATTRMTRVVRLNMRNPVERVGEPA